MQDIPPKRSTTGLPLLAACFSLSLMACQVDPVDPPGDSLQDLRSTQDVRAALAALPSAEVLGAHEDGIPFMVRGRLGRAEASLRGLSARDAHDRVDAALASVAPVFRLEPSNLVARRISWDEQGHAHIRYAQWKNGLPVFGQELIVHVDPEGEIYLANGSARDGEQVPSQPRISAEAARAAALLDTPGKLSSREEPRLVYVRSPKDGRLKLAFEVLVSGEHEGTPVRDHVFVDALDATTVERTSDIHHARNRFVYSAVPPGPMLCSEGTGCTTPDPIAIQAFESLRLFYDCFYANFLRDSYDDSGAALKATVHQGTNYVNAFWDGTSSRLICGDGDGVNAGPLCSDPDVVIHEFTHAVTDFDSNLTYSNEPGALDEGLSDIFGAYCESWGRGWATDADVWKVGEDVWTPGIAGDALRYMADPVLDGASKDYYPERYTGTSDNGGVHWNSGIANLAFKLLSTGGTHPRGKTTVVVPSIGIQKAGAIFYKANRDLWVSATTFAQAKAGTEYAASFLGYDAATIDAVTKAWQAVGVGAPLPPPIALTNGVPKTGLSGAASSLTFYYLDVPAGAPVTFTLSGGTGDVDMYVKFGSAPTLNLYDCRPYKTGNNETCTFAARATAGRYHVMLHGYSAYAGASLLGQWVLSDTTPPTVTLTAPANGSTVSGLVTLSASASDNVGVTRVDFYQGATLLGSDTTAPYSITWDATSVPNGPYTLTARAYDAVALMGVSPPVSVTVGCNATVQVLNNGAFDAGSGSWVASHLGIINNFNISPRLPFSAPFKADLGSTDSTQSLYQQLTVPAAACTAQLTFMLKILSNDVLPGDSLTVSLRNTSGTVLASMGELSHLEPGFSDYAPVTLPVDLTPYRGMTVRLHFESQQDAFNASSFLIDDTALNVRY